MTGVPVVKTEMAVVGYGSRFRLDSKPQQALELTEAPECMH